MGKSYFTLMQSQRCTLVNPFSGLDARGFQRGAYHDPIWKAYIIQELSKYLPDGWSVLFMYYAPELCPDPVVRLILVHTDTSTVEHEIRTPIDPKLRRWGGRIPEVIINFVKLTYAP